MSSLISKSRREKQAYDREQNEFEKLLKERERRLLAQGAISPPSLFHPTRQVDPSGEFVTVHDTDTTWDGIVVPAGTPVLHCHEHQYEAFQYEDIHANVAYRILLILAGWQSGKSSVGDWWLVREMQKCGPGNYLAAAPSFKLLDKYPMRAISAHLGGLLGLGEVVGGAMGEFRVSEAGHKKLWPQDKWPKWNERDPSRIIFGHAQNPDSLASFTGKAAWLDEPGQASFKTESYEEIRGRLSATSGRMLLTTRPYTFNWVKTIHDRAQRNRAARSKGESLSKADSGCELVHFESIDNPRFSREEWDQAELTMPSWRFEMKYRGRFTKPAGAIYDCFDRHKHVLDSFPFAHWKNYYLGFDPGSPNAAAVFVAEELRPEYDSTIEATPTGRYHVYREYYPEESRTVANHVLELCRGERGKPAKAWCGAKSEVQWRLEFLHHGLHVHEPDQPDVEVGISRVYAEFQLCRLTISTACGRLIDQIESYSREIDEVGNVLAEIEEKEKFHLLDALRYVIAGLHPAQQEWNVW